MEASSIPQLSSRRTWFYRRRTDCIAMMRDVRRRWFLYLPIFVIWTLAYMRLFVDHTPRVPLLFNWTPSLPYKVAWLSGNSGEFKRGEFVLFRFGGSAVADYPGLEGQPFFKIIAGVPGDEISVSKRAVFVNGQPVGIAKPRTFDGRILDPIGSGRIPPGHYYVQGTSADSFDSRYAQSGLVPAAAFIGRVRPLL